MVGGTRARTVDVRIIAATNRRLEDEVRGRPLPRGPLLSPERRPPAHPAAARAAGGRAAAGRALRPHLRRRAAQAAGRVHRRGRATRDLAHAWPGNVRELQNVILQAVVLSEGDRLERRRPGAAGGPAPARACRRRRAWRRHLRRRHRRPQRPAAAGAPAAPPAWDALQVAARRRGRARRPRPSRARRGRWAAGWRAIWCWPANEVGRRRARTGPPSWLGLPLTTFVRRLTQAPGRRGRSPRVRRRGPRVADALAAVVAAADRPTAASPTASTRCCSTCVVAPRPGATWPTPRACSTCPRRR